MTLEEILRTFSIESLEQLAADKLMDVGNIRLPEEALIEELISHINKFTYVNSAIYLRTPPCHQILSILLESPDYKHPVKGFKNRVLSEKKQLQEMAQTRSGLNRKKNYGLYLKLLQTAWESEGIIDASEAALLGTMREELGISFKEHIILEHDESLVGYWLQDNNFFERERNYLIKMGIIFPVENTFVIPETLVKHIRKTWGFSLTDEQYRRLFSALSNQELVEILEKQELPVSGSSQQKIDRLLEYYITPLKALQSCTIDTLRSLSREMGSQISGSKEDVILNLIDHVEDDEDLRIKEEKEKAQTPPPLEEKILSEESFKALFGLLSGEQLYNIASSLKGVRKSGNKERKIQNLWEGRFNESSLLSSLSNAELYDMCDKAGAQVSGTKSDKIDRLLKTKLKTKTVELSTDEDLSPEDLIKESTIDSNPVAELREKSSAVFADIQSKYGYLDDHEQTVLVWMHELKSVNENEFERLIARYNIPWYFARTNMEGMIEKLSQNGHTPIEIKHISDHCIYQLTGAE